MVSVKDRNSIGDFRILLINCCPIFGTLADPVFGTNWYKDFIWKIFSSFFSFFLGFYTSLRPLNSNFLSTCTIAATVDGHQSFLKIINIGVSQSSVQLLIRSILDSLPYPLSF